jgi:hypothetical protein
MPLFAQSDLEALIPPDWLVEALDDDANGSVDAFTAAQAWAEGLIKAKLGPRYGLPLPSNDVIDAVLKDIAIMLGVKACYARRPSAKIGEDLAKDITRAQDALDALATGTHPLSPGLEPIKAPAVIISEPARTHYEGLNA